MMIVMFTSWVKNIIFVVLFASFLEILLPNSSMQRFVRVIMGLFIMLAIITPVVDSVQKPLLPMQLPTSNGSSADSVAILNDANNFVHGHEKLSVEVYKKELAQQMQVLIRALEGVADAKVLVDIEENDDAIKGKITGVVVYITPGIGVSKNQIKKVVIGDEVKSVAELDTELTTKVKRLITELYQLPKEIVEVKRLHS